MFTYVETFPGIYAMVSKICTIGIKTKRKKGPYVQRIFPYQSLSELKIYFKCKATILFTIKLCNATI